MLLGAITDKDLSNSGRGLIVVCLTKLDLAFFLIPALVTQPELAITMSPSLSLPDRPICFCFHLQISKSWLLHETFMQFTDDSCEVPFRSDHISMFFYKLK